MTTAAFFLILLSVFLHAGWNLLLKGGRTSLAFCFLLNLSALLCVMPFWLCCPLPPSGLSAKFWLFLGGSIVGEVLYILSLARGYMLFDFSLFYPVARALPVAMLAFGAFFLPLGRERPDAWALLGMGLVFAGSLCMSLPQRKNSADSASRPRHSWLLWCWALMGATGTCLYTGFDHAATNLLHADNHIPWGLVPACAYFAMVQGGLTIANGVLVLLNRQERAALRELMHLPLAPLAAGFFDALCYSLVLLAYTKSTNSAIVFAFRQLGLPVGFLAGVCFLHEKPLPQKFIGLATIVAGLLLSTL